MFALMRNAVAWMKERANRGRSITLVLLGIDNAGKSTVLAALKDEDTDFVTPTFGFNSEELKRGRFKLTVYDLGGGKNLRGLWTRYLAEVHGAIYVVDASDPARLEESREALNAFIDDERFKGKPLLVLANKQDREGALSTNSVSKKLRLRSREGEPILVEVCTAKRPSAPAEDGGEAQQGPLDERITDGIDWLISTIRARHDELTKRIAADVAVQQEQERIEREQRDAIATQRRKERLAEEAKLKAEEEAAADDGAGMRGGDSDAENHPNALNVGTTPEKTKGRKERKSARRVDSDDMITPPAPEPEPAIFPPSEKKASRRNKRPTLDADGADAMEMVERDGEKERRSKSRRGGGEGGDEEAEEPREEPPADEGVDAAVEAGAAKRKGRSRSSKRPTSMSDSER